MLVYLQIKHSFHARFPIRISSNFSHISITPLRYSLLTAMGKKAAMNTLVSDTNEHFWVTSLLNPH